MPGVRVVAPPSAGAMLDQYFEPGQMSLISPGQVAWLGKKGANQKRIKVAHGLSSYPLCGKDLITSRPSPV
jgi:hypothetical protein